MTLRCRCGHPKEIHQHYTLEKYCCARECTCSWYRKAGWLQRLLGRTS